MPRKTKVTQTQVVEVVDTIADKKPKRFVPPGALTNIQLTENQKKLLQIIEDNKVIIILGPAGSGKTIMSCYYAIFSLLKHKYERILFTKPIEESGEHLGFLPGDIADKINPYIESYKGNLLKFINKATYEKLISDEIIEYKPLAFMRGTTHSQSLAVLDEAQNCDLRQLMLFITRMGKNSKVIISGDISQYDIKHNTIGLLKFTEMVKDIPNVAIFNFEKEDIMRDPILIEIVDRYEQLKYSNAPKK